MNRIEFTIPLVPRTKKNSQRIIPNKKGGYFLIPSKAYTDYERACGSWLKNLGVCVNKLQAPLNVRAVFYMPTRRRVDLVNLEEALCDILVKYRIVPDDNCRIIAAMDGSRVEYDKYCPRTEVTIDEMPADRQMKLELEEL